ncbi:bifunctional adenosylcobinamide kinase/adenosylcobinamide-phosphate guanylyltransferase [Pseudalkalibacillus decolorationis]|uniref:bifunctional adenosylcobinamide kinase/adenosylcobinamide-phosphate guanylyltransferase n=1 Tax=Pseudalkalibacillus decolorationis TaxID=163879 RepID=UPI0021483C10|nr:bifunctional adenosylcobinamide kinase/adenosylcobinamide-phosphate guanylyltransferase [Pseudalkalibacillus decolorationis]
MEETPSLIFITGGVRSGKSSFAEKTAIQLAKKSGAHLHYIATGVPSDREMRKRIQNHQQQRQESIIQWQTWEEPREISKYSQHFSEKSIILLDCLTTLLNNHLFSTESESIPDTVEKAIINEIDSLKDICQTLVIVSNEVLNESVQDNALVYTYKKLLGKLHQQLVQQTDQAYLVESGIPILMKGAKE